jgi:hypothetical protein
MAGRFAAWAFIQVSSLRVLRRTQQCWQQFLTTRDAESNVEVVQVTANRIGRDVQGSPDGAYWFSLEKQGHHLLLARRQPLDATGSIESHHQRYLVFDLDSNQGLRVGGTVQPVSAQEIAAVPTMDDSRWRSCVAAAF